MAKVGPPGGGGQVLGRLGTGLLTRLSIMLPRVAHSGGLSVPGLGTVVGWGWGFADGGVCQRPDLWLGGRNGYARRGFAVAVVATAVVQAHHMAVISLICKCKTSFEFSIDCNRVIPFGKCQSHESITSNPVTICFSVCYYSTRVDIYSIKGSQQLPPHSQPGMAIYSNQKCHQQSPPAFYFHHQALVCMFNTTRAVDFPKDFHSREREFPENQSGNSREFPGT